MLVVVSVAVYRSTGVVALVWCVFDGYVGHFVGRAYLHLILECINIERDVFSKLRLTIKRKKF